jgi:hypothetical protein
MVVPWRKIGGCTVVLLSYCGLPLRRLAVVSLYVCIGAPVQESDELQFWGAEMQKMGLVR